MLFASPYFYLGDFSFLEYFGFFFVLSVLSIIILAVCKGYLDDERRQVERVWIEANIAWLDINDAFFDSKKANNLRLNTEISLASRCKNYFDSWFFSPELKASKVQIRKLIKEAAKTRESGVV